jgi:hypothetical protein
MSQAPRWTQEEFEILLQNPTVPAAGLAKRLPGRSVSAIEVVRSGIHAFHTGGDVSMLSKMMTARLEGETEDLVCAICQSPL